MSKPTTMTKEKTFSQRLETVSEIENKINSLNIKSVPSIKVLQLIMDNYTKHGTPCDTKLNLRMGDRDRYIIVKLYNNKNKKDIVLIKAKEDVDMEESAKN